MKSLDVLTNCSSKSSYDWTPDLVQRAWLEIAKTLSTAAKSFGLDLEIRLNGLTSRPSIHLRHCARCHTTTSKQLTRKTEEQFDTPLGKWIHDNGYGMTALELYRYLEKAGIDGPAVHILAFSVPQNWYLQFRCN